MEARLAIILKEFDDGNNLIESLVDKKHAAENEKVCEKCGAPHDLSARTCSYQNCGKTLLKQKFILPEVTIPTSPYSHFEETIKDNTQSLDTIVGEPKMINPSGFENIAEILRDIGIRAGIRRYVKDGKREWLFLENDGAIYSIIIKLIENVFICTGCGKSAYGKDYFENHDCYKKKNIEPEREFDWIILLPGLLHSN